MPISISCSNCGKKYQVRDELAGKVAKCHCGQNLTVPATRAVGAAVPVAESAAQASSADLFADLPRDAVGQGSPLATLAPIGKRRSRKKGGNPLLIVGIAGGAVVALLVVAVVVVALSGGGSQTVAPPASSTPVAAAAPASSVRWPTPKAVFEAQKKAFVEKDWKTAYETYSPDSQRDLTMAMVAMVVNLAPTIPELEVVRTEYRLGQINLDPQILQSKNPAEIQKQLLSQMKQMADQVTDKPGLVAKVMNILTDEKTADPLGILGQMRRQLEDVKDTQLSDVRISGDTASGTRTSTSQGHPKQEPIQFVKIDGQWRVEGKMPAAGTPSP